MAVHVSFRSELHSAELALVRLDPKVDIEVHLQVFLHGEALGTSVALVWTKVFRRVLGHLMVLQQLLWKKYKKYISTEISTGCQLYLRVNGFWCPSIRIGRIGT